MHVANAGKDMHVANAGKEMLGMLMDSIELTLIVILSHVNISWGGQTYATSREGEAARLSGNDVDRLWR